ncbi:NAD(P)H-binding protein [Actinocrispum sp. NPDC049592]|uniref:NAD(P)H-binding protein n=1 Tax=Actinocrispum sp. NPDC049592 TaxID=3154835 RepID=UPI00343127CD
MTILVTGARGRVARSLIQQLQAAGHEVRTTSTTDPATDLNGIHKAFLYATTPERYLSIPTLKHVVLLSALGATNNNDAIQRLHAEAEQTVAESDIPWTFLRPGGFATNRLRWAESIRTEGVVRSPFGDSHSALIHEADIAAVALHALTEPGHEKAIHTLTGPESLTERQQAELIAKATGRPIVFEPQSINDFRNSLHIGPPEVVDAVVNRLTALIDHPHETTNTVTEITGRARTFADWAKDHAEDFTPRNEG